MLDGPLLIANRGEIAVRIAATARRLGIPTVAVFSDADERALHVDVADIAVRIGPAPARESYLRIEALLDAMERTGARAVHPGYGFLSESAAFAHAVADSGLTWVGPPADAIETMGDKGRSKALAQAAGVPVVPGIDGDDPDPEAIAAFADEHAFPLMIKAVAGGGGKGMRVVRVETEIRPGLDSARREAAAAFGDDRVLVEKFLERPRHVEIQVLADSHGGCIHLGERECSLQRRHQKVVEEAPSVTVDTATRAAMGDAALALARACDYEGAGTVEFIVPGDRSGFYFLEMNTRLQVEHPVTELVYGVDLVEQQLRIAAGEPLALRQDDLAPTGWAIEARIYAEDPSAGFLPQTGNVVRWREPAGNGIRVDSGVRTGSEVTTHYDPMLAKLIAHGPDRPTAIARLEGALRELEILGVATNSAFTAALLRSESVRAGELDTGLIERELADLVPDAPDDLLAAAALGLWLTDIEGHTTAPGPWRRLLAGRGEVAVRDGQVSADGRSRPASALWTATGDLRAELDGLSRRYSFVNEGERAWVGRDGHHLEVRSERYRPSAGPSADATLEAPMPSTVLVVNVVQGDAVAEGDVLLVLESMKMELAILAPRDGVVDAIELSAGDRVTRGELLVSLDLAEESE